MLDVACIKRSLLLTSTKCNGIRFQQQHWVENTLASLQGEHLICSWISRDKTMPTTACDMDYCASSKHQLAPAESRSAGRRTRALVFTFFSGIFPDAKLAGPPDTQPGDNTSQHVQTECHALITPHHSQSKDLIPLQTVWKAADSVIAVEVSGVSSATK